LLLLIAVLAVLLAIVGENLRKQERFRTLRDRGNVVRDLLDRESRRVDHDHATLNIIERWDGSSSNRHGWSTVARRVAREDSGRDRPLLLIEARQTIRGRTLEPIQLWDLGGSANAEVIAALKSQCDRLGWPCHVETPEDNPEVAEIARSEGQYIVARSIIGNQAGLALLARDGYSRGTLRTRRGRPEVRWTISYRCEPTDGDEIPVVGLSVTSDAGEPALITVKGNVEGIGSWLSRLTKAYDEEGWTYEVLRVTSPEAVEPGDRVARSGRPRLRDRGDSPTAGSPVRPSGNSVPGNRLISPPGGP
jgi:hypothetical protein